MWLLIVLLSIVSVSLLIALIVSGKSRNGSCNDDVLNELTKTVRLKTSEIEKLRDQLEKVKDEKVALEKVENKSNDLRFLEEEIKNRRDELKEISNNISKLNEEFSSINDNLNAARTENVQLEAIKVQNEEKKALLEGQIVAAICERDRVKGELEELKNRYKMSLDFSDGNGWMWDLKLTSAETKLVELLREIEEEYGELKGDIATIEWRRIWMNKIKELSDREGLEVGGIYRLVLKKDDKICYVGQSINIKDRWSQHIKKMIGVDNKGGEKLYDYKPEDFYWSVIEIVDKGNKEVLNEKEHYWIEFFQGTKGLNSKR